MKTLIIYAHPSKKSFTYQVLESLIKGLKDEGHDVVISDLYALDFSSDMSEVEYHREGLGEVHRTVPQEVLVEQEKLNQADCVFFLYPVWWSDCPAKLKGWFDRIYTNGYAYGYDDSGQKVRGMKTIQAGIVICPAGHPNTLLEETGIAESMRKIMLADRLANRFQHKEMIILGGTLELKKVREQHLAKAYSMGKWIEDRYT